MRKTICLTPSVLNEAKALERFFKHHSWADEIIVVDSGSTDDTEEICKKYSRRIIKYPLGANHNKRSAFIVPQVKSDWFFFIDPDEFISDELRKEIEGVLNDESNIYQAFEIKRINFFMDTPLRRGGWSGYGLKFFRKDSVSFPLDAFHEKPVIKGKVGRLKGEVFHYSNPNIYWMLEKFNYISEFDDKEYFNRYGILSDKKFKRLLISRPFKNFWKCYIKKKGYKEGLVGFIYAAMIWAFDVIRICKYAEKYLIKNHNITPTDKLFDPWECRK